MRQKAIERVRQSLAKMLVGDVKIDVRPVCTQYLLLMVLIDIKIKRGDFELYFHYDVRELEHLTDLELDNLLRQQLAECRDNFLASIM